MPNHMPNTYMTDNVIVMQYDLGCCVKLLDNNCKYFEHKDQSLSLLFNFLIKQNPETKPRRIF